MTEQSTNVTKSENNVVDLSEARAERHGIITPQTVIASVSSQADDIVAIAVVGLLRDGNVATSFSTANPVTLLGMLEIAKDDVLYAGADE